MLVFCEQSVLFKPLDINNEKKYPTICLTHLIDFSENSIKLYIDRSIIDQANEADLRDKLEFQVKWITDTLIPKIQTWCQNIPTDSDMSSTKLATLTLYSNMIEDYNKLYQELKVVYWHRFADTWFEITSTNPEKFIYEDIAIATYFILLWRHYNLRVQQFVDLGCGNGLLVYILNDQGFNGYGIDMRSRKIWSNNFYTASKIRLIEQTINPQIDTFIDCDWLIGNHSDELSPWLPVIAARSNQLQKPCNFLLIPCCMFDFHSKFELKKKGESRFNTYLDFLEKVCRLAGFEVYRDKLRIPSTRNFCLICRYKKDVNNSDIVDTLDLELKKKIDELISGHADTGKFVARDLVQEQAKSARNCTKNIEKGLQMMIVKQVIENLLLGNCVFIKKWDGGEWNAGRQVSLTDIAGLFETEMLAKMKQECGGVKTLLKNFHQLFLVFDRDQVRLKVWKLKKTSGDKDGCHEVYRYGDNNERVVIAEGIVQFSRAKANKIGGEISKLPMKTKQCLFDLLHPDGCLLSNEECDFRHSNFIESH